MSNDIQPQIAAAKVIATGDAGNGWLRATIMLSPMPPPRQGSSLAKWPSQMLGWLKSMRTQSGSSGSESFRLQLLVQPVVYVGASSKCVALPANDVSIEAHASALEAAWKTQGDNAWVDDLWIKAFAQPDIDPQTLWTALAEAIGEASRSDSLVLGNSGMGSVAPKPTIHTTASRDMKDVANKEKATLDWILPSNQTELALLLEYKRAHELCDSAKFVMDGSEHAVVNEITCSQITRHGDQPDEQPQKNNIDDLFDFANTAYTNARTDTSNFYSGGICAPQPVAAPVATAPEQLASAERIYLQENVQRPLDSYEAANQPQRYGEDGKYPISLKDKLLQTFYAIQSSPTLSRLFCLTIDVQFESAKLRLPEGPQASDGGYFFYLALADGTLCQNSIPCRIHTLAKYRDDSRSRYFWPVTRAEVGLGRECSSMLYDLSQYNGLMVAGRRVDVKGGGVVSRFELSCLDVHSAAEAELDRRKIKISDEDLRQQCTSASPAQLPAAIARKTYQTAGLQILDRGRQQQAASQFAARIVHSEKLTSPALVLDADDLTVGYRIDVGVPLNGPAPSYAWRGLMARIMKYGTGRERHAHRVKAIADKLFIEAQDDVSSMKWRQCIEDGWIALPARLIPRHNNPDVVDAYVEEAIAAWHGEPMSVPCAGQREMKVDAFYGLPTGCVVVAPTDRKDPRRRPPALRFGWPYRVGLRAVFSGGLSVPLSMASAFYDEDRSAEFPLGGALTIPAISAIPRPEQCPEHEPPALQSVNRKEQLRRFLRHERIDAPFLLLPEALALRENGPMGNERAAHAVVRTASGNAKNRGVPVLTQRVFAVANVSQDFASLHGVFDKMRDAKPPQGLASSRFGRNGVRFDAKTIGGFPIVASEYIVGFNGVRYLKSRYVSTDVSGENAQGGDLVYALASGRSGKREVPYFPDPAARKFVIGIRVAGSSTYLECKTAGYGVIDAYNKGDDYPDARPLVVTIQRSQPKQTRAAYPKVEDVLTVPHARANGRVAGLPMEAKRVPGSVEALLTLAPGDDFEIDVWCVPDESRLRQQFAILESVGSLAIARARHKDISVCDALKDMLPKLACDVFERCLAPNAGDIDTGSDPVCSGTGGLKAPGPRMRDAIAQALYQSLILSPLDEISAVRTLRVTHAIGRPLHDAKFVPSPIPEGSQKTQSDDSVVLTRLRNSQDQRDAYTAIGDVLIHLPTTGSLEICADMASPTSDRFDDTRRARPLSARSTPWKDSDDPMKVFGFDVLPNNEVILAQTRDVMLHVLTDIPAPNASEHSERVDGLHRIPLRQIVSRAEADAKIGTRKPTFQFSDGLARLLCLRVVAHPRHSDQMRTARRRAVDGQWLRDGTELDTAPSSKPEYLPVWLPAAVRPAEPAARTPVPAFLWTTEKEQTKEGPKYTRTRRTVIRIPLARPWFSSGEDERLGIVVWPPNLFDLVPGEADNLTDDQVKMDAREGHSNSRLINLPDFQDEDLGPGGKFVTRWGGDPIRTQATLSPSRRRTFIPREAFLDFGDGVGTGFSAELVRNVHMPVRITEDAPVDAKEQTAANVPPTLTVSLLTYMPRFDVVEEQWYVDVAMEHALEAEPFVRLGLVRYQPHAPEDLRVSYPVMQWTQLLPKRTVTVTRKKGAVSIDIAGLATSPVPDQSESNDEQPAVAKMTVRIVRQFDLDTGIRMQSAGESEVLTPQYQANVEAFAVKWQKELPFEPRKDQDVRERAKYYVLVEEREARLPATYADEPVSSEMAMGRDCNSAFDPDLLIESGPRFLAKIDI